MLLNSNLFYGAVNINDKFEEADENGDESRLEDLTDTYEEIMRETDKRELDKEDLNDHIKELTDDGEDPEDAKNEALDDLVAEDWADGSLQLWYVPDNCVLSDALRLYYDHLIKDGSWLDGVKKYARGGVVTDHGFYFLTGLGYSIKDELFAGVPIKNRDSNDGVGSGKPFDRFLKYINSVK